MSETRGGVAVGYGYYFVTTKCGYCGEDFTTSAMANYRPYCEACAFVFEQEREYKKWLSASPVFWPYGHKQ